MAEPVLDRQILEEVIGTLERKFEMFLVQYIRYMKDAVSEMDLVCSAGNWTIAASICGKMKELSHQIGANRLYHLTKGVEAQFLKGNFTVSPDQFMSEAVPYIRQGIAQFEGEVRRIDSRYNRS